MSSTSTTERQPGVRLGSLYLWAMAIPGALLIAGTAAMLIAVSFGVDPLWRVEPITLPEAASLRDNGEVVRLIARGDDPNAAGPVREDFVYHDALVLTPLEAAVGARRAEMVELLLANGAMMDAAIWARLTCFADVVKAPDVRELLETHRPDNAPPPECGAVETPWP